MRRCEAWLCTVRDTTMTTKIVQEVFLAIPRLMLLRELRPPTVTTAFKATLGGTLSKDSVGGDSFKSKLWGTFRSSRGLMELDKIPYCRDRTQTLCHGMKRHLNMRCLMLTPGQHRCHACGPS